MQHLCINKLRLLPACLWLLTALTLPQPGHADIALSFVPLEEAKFIIKGEGFVDCAAVTVTVHYDTTYLSTPEVTVMGGRLQSVTGGETTPGRMQLNILNEERSPVFEACVFFQKQGDYPAVINFVTAETTDAGGSQMPLDVAMMPNPNVAVPSQAVVEPTKDQEMTPHPLADSAEGAPKQGDPPVEPLKPAIKSVFEQFRDYAGEKSLAGFSALFSATAPCCRQTPAILIADGKSTALITSSGVLSGEEPPSCSVSGGALLSLQRATGDKGWTLTVRPDAGAWDVSLSCVAEDTLHSVPLAVAPMINMPLHKLAAVSEKEFPAVLRAYLDGNRSRKLPEHPVWLQEYIFTANYLAARELRANIATDALKLQPATQSRERGRTAIR